MRWRIWIFFRAFVFTVLSVMFTLVVSLAFEIACPDVTYALPNATVSAPSASRPDARSVPLSVCYHHSLPSCGFPFLALVHF